MSVPPPDIIDRDLLRTILLHPLNYEWRPHGIGMLRTYLDGPHFWRLDLWHSALLTPDISVMHTHTWPFTSFIMAGSLVNTRFTRLSPEEWQQGHVDPQQVREYFEGRIGCGAHYRGLEGDPERVWLLRGTPEVLVPKMTYAMQPDEIHATTFRDGSVTVICRGTPETEGEMASVFWPVEEAWGDATMTVDEPTIIRVTAACLNQVNLARGDRR